MKVKMLKTLCGPDGSFTAPHEYDVDQTVAIEWAKTGACELLEEPVVSKPVEKAVIEPDSVRKVEPEQKEAKLDKTKIRGNRRNGSKQ